jgi:hypothetical protein
VGVTAASAGPPVQGSALPDREVPTAQWAESLPWCVHSLQVLDLGNSWMGSGAGARAGGGTWAGGGIDIALDIQGPSDLQGPSDSQGPSGSVGEQEPSCERGEHKGSLALALCRLKTALVAGPLAIS